MIKFIKLASRLRKKTRFLKPLVKALLRIKKLKRDFVESQTCIMNFKQRDTKTIKAQEKEIYRLQHIIDTRKYS